MISTWVSSCQGVFLPIKKKNKCNKIYNVILYNKYTVTKIVLDFYQQTGRKNHDNFF